MNKAELRAAYKRLTDTLNKEYNLYHSLHAVAGMERYTQALEDLKLLGRAVGESLELQQPEQPALLDVPKSKRGGY